MRLLSVEKMNSNCNDIIFNEKYVNIQNVNFVKLHDQSNVVVVTNKEPSPIWKGWWAIMLQIFLPQGYPCSVSDDYLAYQIWDTAQAFSSTIMGILATQEVLRGVGVGETTATPLAATITWVFKDGCGHLARIIFAYGQGSRLDSYSKKWRLYADILNDAALCIEIALPLFSKYTTLALCVSSMFKSIVGVAGGATRIAMTRHHALRLNMADVAAKDAAQETAVNLVASMTALIIIYFFRFHFFIFFLMMVLHIFFNYLAVSAVCLRTLNEPRFLLVINNYLEMQSVASPCDINKLEPILSCPRWLNFLGYNSEEGKPCSYKIKIGQSLRNLLKIYKTACDFDHIKETYAEKEYIVVPDTLNLVMYVFLKENASAEDILCGYFHAVVLSIVMESIFVANGNEPRISACKLPLVREASYRVCQEYREQSSFGIGSFKPSIELLKSFLLTATREWDVYLKPQLEESGWDLTKQLLTLDEWRITDYKIKTNRRLSSSRWL